MKKEHPITTLFLLSSLDGKTSTGAVNDRDYDKDLKVLPGIMEGVQQYYDIEGQTDIFSLNTGKTMAKIGVNTEKNPIHCPDLTFIIIDNNHLNSHGINNLCDNLHSLILVSQNEMHPAFEMKRDNMLTFYYEDEIDFVDLFHKFKKDYGIERITVQSGGTMNAVLLRENLIDKVAVVVAPCLVGGKDTPSMVDGRSLVSKADLKLIKTMKLEKAEILENSFLYLNYDITNN